MDQFTLVFFLKSTPLCLNMCTCWGQRYLRNRVIRNARKGGYRAYHFRAFAGSCGFEVAYCVLPVGYQYCLLFD
jgi:hypothetical protein